jgi:hypothetical protein
LGAFPVKVFRAGAMIAIFGYGRPIRLLQPQSKSDSRPSGSYWKTQFHQNRAISDRMEHSTNYNGFNYLAVFSAGARFSGINFRVHKAAAGEQTDWDMTSCYDEL